MKGHVKPQCGTNDDHAQRNLAKALSGLAPHEQPQESPLSSLLPELIIVILEECNLETLMRLRLVCKTMNEHVTTLFTSRLFERHVLQVFLSRLLVQNGSLEFFEFVRKNFDTFTIRIAGEESSWWYVARPCICQIDGHEQGTVWPPPCDTPYDPWMARFQKVSWQHCISFKPPPPSLSKAGVISAFGPKYLVRFLFRLSDRVDGRARDAYENLSSCRPNDSIWDPDFEVISITGHVLGGWKHLPNCEVPFKYETLSAQFIGA